jgi:hypothetical protein
MIHRRLGALPEADLTALSALLRKTLALQDG